MDSNRLDRLSDLSYIGDTFHDVKCSKVLRPLIEGYRRI
jgi:hypothetical protein